MTEDTLWNSFNEIEKEAYMLNNPSSIYAKVYSEEVEDSPRFPNVNVKLVGEDGNAFAIVSRVVASMKDARLPNFAIAKFKDIIFKGDYNHLLQTVMDWVSVDNNADYNELLERPDDEIKVGACDTKYPEIKVKITGKDGNAFAIIGYVRNALKEHKVSQKEIDDFTKEATSGDYNNLIQVCFKWVDLE